MKKPKLAIVGTVGVPAKYGGFETLAEYILEDMVHHFEVTVFCETNAYKGKKLTRYKGAELKYISLKANGSQSIFYDIISILKSFGKADYLLILGVSGTMILPFIRNFTKAKIITNIDGLEWQRDKWDKKAKYFLKWSEKLAVQYSDLIISDNLHIQEYVASEYSASSLLIAYGGDHVTKEDKNPWVNKYAFLLEKYAFTVCRIEPENNLDMIITSYLNSNQLMPYIIVGNWQASEYGRRLIQKYQKEEKLRLMGPIYDQQELNVLRSNCAMYLHGHSAGGTNPSLVEAMYLGLPIIAYGVSYNRATTNHLALYFYSDEELLKLLNAVHEQELEKVARQVKQYAEENYIWEKISKQYVEALLSYNS
jgi:glycosyltransferase involved in cell wall biosynthesis